MKATFLGVIVLGGLLVGACSSEEPATRRGGPRSGDPGAGGDNAPGATGPTPTCPADVAAPTSVATDGDATDVRVVGGTVYFRTGTKIVKVNKDGSGRAEVYTSTNLVRAFTDGTTLVAVESPNPPAAVIRVGLLGGNPDEANQVGTDLVAAGTQVFGVDENNVFAVGEGGNGDTIYRIAKAGGGLETVMDTEGVVTDPQIAGDSLWYVKNSTEIYKLPREGGEATLVATVEAGCNLAVGATRLYCSVGGAVEERDLAGANPKKVFDATSSKVNLAFGLGTLAGDAFVARSSGEGPLKGVLRVVSPGAERVVACGRDNIGALGTDGTTVAWAEAGKGVFAAAVK